MRRTTSIVIQLKISVPAKTIAPLIRAQGSRARHAGQIPVNRIDPKASGSIIGTCGGRGKRENSNGQRETPRFRVSQRHLASLNHRNVE